MTVNPAGEICWAYPVCAGRAAGQAGAYDRRAFGSSACLR